MAENKKSFLLYTDLVHTVRKLSTEQAGELFKLILSYVNDEDPDLSEIDFVLQIAFEPVKQGLKRDLKRYQNIVERNRKNGVKGGRPRKEPKKPSGLFGNPKNPVAPKKANNKNKNNKEELKKERVKEKNGAHSLPLGFKKKEIVFNEFYDEQLKTAKDENYKGIIKFLFGENSLGQKLDGVLSIEKQLTEEQFGKILEKCNAKKLSLGDILLSIENDKKYYTNKKSLYLTLNRWLNNNFANK